MDSRIQRAINSDPQGRLNDPNVLKEDDPPMLRFERSTIKDPIESEKRGIYIPMDAIKVHVKAYGDIKNEVPYIAEKYAYEPSFEQFVVEKTVPVKVIKQKVDEDGVVHEVEETKYETKEVLEERATYDRVIVHPWIDQLRDRYRNGRISERYFNFCVNAFEKWKESGDVPVEGYPVIEWRMATPAQQEMLIAIGINSVEKVAEMNEDTLTAFGMGGRDLKKKAAEFLLAGTDQAQSAAKILALESKVERDAVERSRLEEKLHELEQLIQAQRGESQEVTDDGTESNSEDVS